MSGDKSEEIEITEKMLAAGIAEAREHPLGQSLRDLVSNIYIAMVIELQEGGSPSASSRSSVK
jgi:hypothetical protein